MAVYTIKDETLINIADAIRNKTGATDTIKPIEMADEIDNLTTIPNECLALTGSMSHIDYYGRWDWYFTQYADKITTNNITHLSNAFY
jgi:hypothetical protein